MNAARTRIVERYRGYRSQVDDLPRRLACQGTTLHSGRNMVKKMTLASPGREPLEVAVKAFRVPARPRGFIYAHLRRSKALRCMIFGRRLLEIGVSTPDPVACIEQEEFGCLRSSFYVCRYWEPDFDLFALLYESDKEESAGLNTGALLEQLARFTFLLHQKGVTFSDYNPGNILVKSRNGFFEFSLVDINRLRFKQPDMEDRIDGLIRLTTVGEYLGAIGREYAGLYGADVKAFCRRLERAQLRLHAKTRAKKRVKSLFRREN